MTALPDLTPITAPYRGPVVLAVGWLGRPHRFARGETSKEFLYRLWDFVPYKYASTLGVHNCDYCNQSADISPSDMPFRASGSAELRVFWQGITYAAPDMITHHVRNHQYKPPDEFIRAVLEGPKPATQEYEDLLLALITSHAHPFDEYHPRLISSGLKLREIASLPPPTRYSREFQSPRDGRGYYKSQLDRNPPHR